MAGPWFGHSRFRIPDQPRESHAREPHRIPVFRQSPHTAISDGIITGTGIECSMNVRACITREEACMLLSIIGELRIGTSPRPVMATRLIVPEAQLREAGWDRGCRKHDRDDTG
jgi:hypothetical protein